MDSGSSGPRRPVLAAALLAAPFLYLPNAAPAATYGGASLDGTEFSCHAAVRGPDHAEHHYDVAVVFKGDTALVNLPGMQWTINLIESDISDLGDIEGYFIDADGSHYYLFLDCSGD